MVCEIGRFYKEFKSVKMIDRKTDEPQKKTRLSPGLIEVLIFWEACFFGGGQSACPPTKQGLSRNPIKFTTRFVTCYFHQRASSFE